MKYQNHSVYMEARDIQALNLSISQTLDYLLDRRIYFVKGENGIIYGINELELALTVKPTESKKKDIKEEAGRPKKEVITFRVGVYKNVNGILVENISDSLIKADEVADQFIAVFQKAMDRAKTVQAQVEQWLEYMFKNVVSPPIKGDITPGKIKYRGLTVNVEEKQESDAYIRVYTLLQKGVAIGEPLVINFKK